MSIAQSKCQNERNSYNAHFAFEVGEMRIWLSPVMSYARPFKRVDWERKPLRFLLMNQFSNMCPLCATGLVSYSRR